MPLPLNQPEDQKRVAQLSEAELAAELENKQKQIEEIRRLESEASAERVKKNRKLQEENLDKLIEALTDNEQKVQAAKDAHEARCTKAKNRPTVIEQADKDLRSKLLELESAMSLFRNGLQLPYNCPRKLEEVKVFKAQYLKNEAERIAREKVQEEENKKYQEKYEAEYALALLNREKQARATKEQEAKIEAHDKQLGEKADKKYSVWHKTLGAALALAVCFIISPALPTSAAAYTILAGAALFGAALGQMFRNATINAGKFYRFQADVDHLSNYYQPRAEEKTAALKAGVEAATWKGYFNSFTNGAAYRQPNEFRAGMIQAITENEEVVKAIRNR